SSPSTPCPTASGERDYCHPRPFPGSVTNLYRNLGRQPDGKTRFQDVTHASGLGRLKAPGLGVVCADFDGDGWPDLFVANDGVANHLWVNRHDATVAEEA